jgi:hypothetical protein
MGVYPPGEGAPAAEQVTCGRDGEGDAGTRETETPTAQEAAVPSNIKNEKQYEALKDKGMSKERAARIANSPDASTHGGQQSGKGGDPHQGGTTAQKKEASRKGGQATARKNRG